jgi:hypothetical protein
MGSCSSISTSIRQKEQQPYQLHQPQPPTKPDIQLIHTAPSVRSLDYIYHSMPSPPQPLSPQSQQLPIKRQTSMHTIKLNRANTFKNLKKKPSETIAEHTSTKSTINENCVFVKISLPLWYIDKYKLTLTVCTYCLNTYRKLRNKPPPPPLNMNNPTTTSTRSVPSQTPIIMEGISLTYFLDRFLDYTDTDRTLRNIYGDNLEKVKDGAFNAMRILVGVCREGCTVASLEESEGHKSRQGYASKRPITRKTRYTNNNTNNIKISQFELTAEPLIEFCEAYGTSGPLAILKTIDALFHTIKMIKEEDELWTTEDNDSWVCVGSYVISRLMPMICKCESCQDLKYNYNSSSKSRESSSNNKSNNKSKESKEIKDIDHKDTVKKHRHTISTSKINHINNKKSLRHNRSKSTMDVIQQIASSDSVLLSENSRNKKIQEE